MCYDYTVCATAEVNETLCLALLMLPNYCGGVYAVKGI